MAETLDVVTVTVVTTTTKTFEIEVHELAEITPRHDLVVTLADLHSLAVGLAEKLRIDADEEVDVQIDIDAADLFIHTARQLATRED